MAVCGEDTSEEEDSSDVEPRGPLADTVGSSADEATENETSSSDDENKTKGERKFDGGIFAPSRRLACCGYLAQYFSVGIIYGGLPGTIYGVFLGYLGVPSYVYATVGVVMTMPWSFKFAFGLLNDTLPICGQRRRPYMTLGWAFCAAMLLVLAATPLPDPYWCVDGETGTYIKSKPGPEGKKVPADPCNPDAATHAGLYAFLMMLAALGYVVADVAADGLTVEYAKEEPLEVRGHTQATAYLARTIGQATTTVYVGFCMNGKLYNGSFDWGLSFNQVMLGFAIPAFVMVPVSFFLIHEPVGKGRESCTGYMKQSWELLKNKAFLFVIVFNFLTTAVGGVSTTAGGNVKQNWAGVKNLQNQMFSLVGHLLFAFGLWLTRKYFLNVSWRWMLATTTIFLNLVDMIFTTLTTFDIVRNQYFYLGETVLLEVPGAANFVVGTFVVVEMADEGNEGLVYGLLTTAFNLGMPFAQAISNQLFGLFKPALSDEDNYIEDTPAFRWTVFWSFLVSYSFSFVSLGCLGFLPPQKEEAQHRKQSWPRRPLFGAIALTMLFFSLFYSLMVDVLSMLPSTMCMKIAGGSGCDS